MKNQHKFPQQQNAKRRLSIQCLSIILLDSVFRTGKTYYPQNAAKEKKIPKYIIDDIQISLDSDREYSDEENSNWKNSDEENSEIEN